MITLGATHPQTPVLGHCWYVGWVEPGRSAGSHRATSPVSQPPPLCHSHKVELTTSEMGLVVRCSLGLRSPCEMQQIPFSCCNGVSLLSNSW